MKHIEIQVKHHGSTMPGFGNPYQFTEVTHMRAVCPKDIEPLKQVDVQGRAYELVDTYGVNEAGDIPWIAELGSIQRGIRLFQILVVVHMEKVWVLDRWRQSNPAGRGWHSYAGSSTQYFCCYPRAVRYP